MCFFTIFTPTYNRAYRLSVLYESLKSQTCKDFEWLIVDDGSTDNTYQTVNAYKKETEEFPIRYYKKENGGKPRAINYGITFAKGRYFFMIDSDDFFLPDAVKKMKSWCLEIDNDSQFIGAGAARGYPNGSYIRGCAPLVNHKGYIDATNIERKKFNLDADMTEAYKTALFRKYPMAEWPGEKFAPEQIALNEISLSGYKLRWHADIIHICEYLDDGLTKGSFELEKKNPMGYAMMYNHKLKYPISKREKYHAACQHIALSIYGKHLKYIKESNNKIYTFFALPIGLILAIRRSIQFRKE